MSKENGLGVLDWKDHAVAMEEAFESHNLHKLLGLLEVLDARDQPKVPIIRIGNLWCWRILT